MNLDDNWRKKWDPCKEAWDWLEAQEDRDAEKVIRKLVSEKRYDWSLWALHRCMSRESAVRLAIFSARLVLPIYEKEFPDDDRPRRAIEAAERGGPDCVFAAASASRAANALFSSSDAAIYAAAYVADSAAYAADSAAYAADASAKAHDASADASYAASASSATSSYVSSAYLAANFAANFAAYATYARAHYADAEKEKTVMKITEFGFELMRNELEEKHDEPRR